MGPRALLTLLVFLLVSGCATPEKSGHWQALDMAFLRLSQVTLLAGTGEGAERLCRGVRGGIEGHLVRALPQRLHPVGFLGPGADGPRQDTGTLRLTITQCRLESHQWDVGGGEPDFTFYLTIGLGVALTSPEGRRILDRHFQTVEAVHTDLPTPLFEFNYHRPAARIASLFSQGRVWVRSEGTEGSQGPSNQKAGPARPAWATDPSTDPD